MEMEVGQIAKEEDPTEVSEVCYKFYFITQLGRWVEFYYVSAEISVT